MRVLSLLPVLLALIALAVTDVRAQLTTYAWPLGDGQALASDKYEVYVALGSEPERRIDVLMSPALAEGDWMAAELTGRTFSFAVLGYQPAGAPLRFRVVKKFGQSADAVEIAPRRHGLAATLVGGTEARFSVEATTRHFSINFQSADNRTATRKWIKHMLCVFIDPPETDRPDRAGPGVVVYSGAASAAQLAGATTLYFPPGHHDLRAYTGGGPIVDGILKLGNGQSVYLAGGAWVDGLIETKNASSDRGQRVYGRGVLSGRRFPWYGKPGYNGPRYQQIVRLGPEAVVEGITCLESPAHGVVAGNRAHLSHFKLIGWHANNDAVRVGSGSEIAHSFIRAVDDHFYNFDNWVHDCVLWAGHNGAILTYGWGGTAVGDTYHAGSSLLEDIDIINPEWIGLGNNNGLVAAQVGCDYKPYGYGGDPQTVLRRIRVEGSIPGLVNLKPRSTGDGILLAVPVPAADVGYLGDLHLQEITVDACFATGRLKGKADSSTTGGLTYYVQNVLFENVRIGGEWLTATNARRYLTIDEATTRNIGFANGGAGTLVNLSTRGQVLNGADIMIAGFVVVGGPRRLLLRGVGPALADAFSQFFSRGEVLADPAIKILPDSTAALGNDNWSVPAGAAIASVATAVGAFPLQPGSRDAALVATFAPGVYTVQLSGADGGTGLGLAELYDADGAGSARLTNLSTRGRVGTGEAIMIPGFVLEGGAQRLLLRGVGPGLAAAFPNYFSVGEVLPDPGLTLLDARGVTVAVNDNWSSQPSAAAVGTVARQVGAFALPSGSADAALLVTLPPGAYTALVADKGGRSGLALVEVYEAP